MKRLLAIAMALTLLIGCLPMTVALAADPTTGVVVGGKLRLRNDPNTSSTIITAYPTGTVLTILRVQNSEWYAVKGPDGREGFVMSKFVDTSATPPTPTPSGLYDATVVSQNGKGVRLRLGPGTTYGVQAVYPVGTKVTVLNHGTYWDHIRVGFRTGYMMNQFLYSSVTPTPTPTDNYYATVYASNGYGVRLRSYPSTSATIIGMYSVGTSVLVLKHDTYWDYIRIGTRQGYMMNQFLVTSGSVTAVSITPTAVSVDKGDTTTFSASVSGTGYYSKDITWSVSGNASASTTISTAGVLTVGSDETAATLTVTAKSNYNTGKYATATVTVTTPTPKPTVTDVVVTADGGKTNVVKGASQQFTAVVNGTNSPAQTVTWSLSGTYDIGTTIDTSGKLTVAAAETKTAITVMATSTVDTAKNGTSTIGVVDKLVDSIAVKTQPTKLSYTEGETLDLAGLVITVTYADTTTKDVALADFGTNKLAASPQNGASLTVSGHNGKPVVITYNNDTTKTASTSNLTVAAKTVASVAVSAAPSKVDYFEGQHFNPAGLKLLVTYADGSTIFVEYSAVTAAAFTFAPDTTAALAPSDASVTISYAGKSTSQTITVTPRVVTGIEVTAQPNKLQYEVGDALDLTGIKVKLSYNDSTEATAGLSDFATYSLTANPADGAALSSANHGLPVVITYNSSSIIAATSNLSVINVSSIAVSKDPDKMSYVENQALSLAGMEVTITYSDSSTRVVTYADFTANSLTASPADGTVLTLANDGAPVTVTYGSSAITANSGNLGVVAKAVASITPVTTPRLGYIDGQALDLSGCVVQLLYNDGTQDTVPYASFPTYSLTMTPADGTPLTMADNGATVTVAQGAINTSVGTISVMARAITSISVASNPTLSYTEGQSLDLSGLSVDLNYNDGSTTNVAFADFGANGLTTSIADGTTLTMLNNGQTITVTHTATSFTTATGALSIVPVPATLTGIAVDVSSTAQTIYLEGATFLPDGLVLLGSYSDGSTATISYAGNEADFIFLPTTSQALTTADTSVRIAYKVDSMFCTLNITVATP